MVRQAEIIIRAKINHPPPIGDRDLGILRAGYDPLGLVKTLRFNFIECFGNVFGKFREHCVNDSARRKKFAGMGYFHFHRLTD